MCVSARRNYAGGDSAVAAARDFGNAAVMAALQPSGWAVGDDVAIVLSELVTEALETGAHAVSVNVTVHYDHIAVVLERRDGDAEPAGPGITSEEGALRRAVLGALTSEITRSAEGAVGIVEARLPCDPALTTNVSCRFRGEGHE
jgi:hypothetical protein